MLALMLLFGCAPGGSESTSDEGGIVSPPESREESSDTEKPPPDPAPQGNMALNTGVSNKVIDAAVQENIARFYTEGMSEYEMARAAFDYIIANTTLIDPVGLDLWRYRGDDPTVPGFVENRSLSVLLFHIGMCEDYAAALTMLLRGMGLEAEYVPGLTYTAAGTGFVDHAWVVAKIDGVWYHLDCQLEDNISRRDTIRYKYFMRGDATMAASHRWGQNLIDTQLLTQEQNDRLAEDFIAPACPQDWPTPEPYTFTPGPVPDRDTLEAEIAAEREEYEEQNGALEPLELNIIPPVFGEEGFSQG